MKKDKKLSHLLKESQQSYDPETTIAKVEERLGVDFSKYNTPNNKKPNNRRWLKPALASAISIAIVLPIGMVSGYYIHKEQFADSLLNSKIYLSYLALSYNLNREDKLFVYYLYNKADKEFYFGILQKSENDILENDITIVLNDKTNIDITESNKLYTSKISNDKNFYYTIAYKDITETLYYNASTYYLEMEPKINEL